MENIEIFKQISKSLQQGRTKKVKDLITQAIDKEASADDILNNGLLTGMNEIGEKFKNNQVFVPEVLMAAKSFNSGLELLKPLLANEKSQSKGTVIIGTVKGDQHDIGKNLVKLMMESKGLNVIDLGVNVPAEKFIQTAIDNNASIICCSALLTTTMPEMKKVIELLKTQNLYDKIIVMVGGAPVTQDFCNAIEAHCYTKDAASAANFAAEIID